MNQRPEFLIHCFDLALNTFLSRKTRFRLGRHIYYNASGEGDYHGDRNGEHELYARLSRRLPDHAVIFDVGANVGEWSAMARGQRVRPRHLTIHAFEPTLSTFEELSQRFNGEPPAAGPCNGEIKLHHAALSDRQGSTTLYLEGQCGGRNTLHRDPSCGPRVNASEEVALWRGDDFCREQGIDRIDFLKIDTEGHEAAIFAGLSRMLSEQRITWIQFEYGECWVRSRVLFKDVYELFSGYGYRLAKIFPGGVLPVGSYSTEMENFTLANYLAYLPWRERDLELIQ